MTGLRRFGPLLAVFALLAAAAVAAALATPQITTVPVPFGRETLGPENQGRGTFSPPPAPQNSAAGKVQHDVALPGWATTLVSVICLLVVLAAVGLVAWLLLRDRLDGRRRFEPAVEEVTVTDRREQVLAAVDAGLSGLDDSDTDPRRAVIACWVRLEEAAAAAGTPRQPGDAPGDLVLRLLSAHQVSAGVLVPLAEVYRLARYATHTVDSGMRDSARAALRQLRAELAGEPAMGSPK
jgi:hypothetical protein